MHCKSKTEKLRYRRPTPSQLKRLEHQWCYEGVAICQYIKDFVFAHKDVAQPTSGSHSQVLPSLGQLPLKIQGHKEQRDEFFKSQLFVPWALDVQENQDRIESIILLLFIFKKRTGRWKQKRILSRCQEIRFLISLYNLRKFTSICMFFFLLIRSSSQPSAFLSHNLEGSSQFPPPLESLFPYYFSLFFSRSKLFDLEIQRIYI